MAARRFFTLPTLMPASDSPASLEGVWLPLKAELSGAPAPDLIIARTELTFRDGTYLVRFDREIADRGTYQLAATALPETHPFPTLTLAGTLGPNEGRSIPCIYQLVGDRLRICYGLDGTLPDAFATTTDTPRYLVFYRRQSA